MPLESFLMKRIMAYDYSRLEDVYPNCSRLTDGFHILLPGEEGCRTSSFFIAANNTNFNITVKYIRKSEEILDTITRNKPFAVSVNESSDSKVYSKIKCLETTFGCKFHIAYAESVSYTHLTLPTN